MRGVPQSCPLSILLYIIETAVVPIRGIQIGEQVIKRINFGDNTTIFLRDISVKYMSNISKLSNIYYSKIYQEGN